MFEIEDLFGLTIDGAFSSLEEFKSFAKEVDTSTLFSVITPGAFKDLQEFQSSLTEKKNQVDTPSSGQEVPTESTTETETIPGSSDSLEGQEEEVEISIPDAPSRKGILQNEDGSVSTHKMRTETDGQGNWFSFPTVFQNEDGSFVDMSEQAEQDWNSVYEEAQRKGEVVNFGSDKNSAIQYGKGSWKNKFDARNNNELLNSVGYIEAKGQNRNILDDLKEKGDERVDDIIMEKTYPVMENG